MDRFKDKCIRFSREKLIPIGKGSIFNKEDFRCGRVFAEKQDVPEIYRQRLEELGTDDRSRLCSVLSDVHHDGLVKNATAKAVWLTVAGFPEPIEKMLDIYQRQFDQQYEECETRVLQTATAVSSMHRVQKRSKAAIEICSRALSLVESNCIDGDSRDTQVFLGPLYTTFGAAYCDQELFEKAHVKGEQAIQMETDSPFARRLMVRVCRARGLHLEADLHESLIGIQSAKKESPEKIEQHARRVKPSKSDNWGGGGFGPNDDDIPF